MTIPTITPLQFLVLSLIEARPNSCTYIRDNMRRTKEMEGPAFYQMMLRMERLKLVKGEYFIEFGTRNKSYWITKLGRAELRLAREFYR